MRSVTECRKFPERNVTSKPLIDRLEPACVRGVASCGQTAGKPTNTKKTAVDRAGSVKDVARLYGPANPPCGSLGRQTETWPGTRPAGATPSMVIARPPALFTANAMSAVEPGAVAIRYSVPSALSRTCTPLVSGATPGTLVIPVRPEKSRSAGAAVHAPVSQHRRNG